MHPIGPERLPIRAKDTYKWRWAHPGGGGMAGTQGMAVRRLLLAAAILAAVVRPAAADTAFETYLQEFYEAALWNDGKVPTPIHKWTNPVRVRMTGPMVGSYADTVMDRLRQLTAMAGIEVALVAPGATDENFLVEFVETHELFAGGRAAGCVSYTDWNAQGEITKARLVINLSQGFGLRRCITHESMHALGFAGHPQAIDSVLSYVYQREDATEIDKISLQTLYDPRVKPGLFQLPGMAAASDVVVDKLLAAHILPDGGVEAARAQGRQFVANLVPLTISLAEKGNVALQFQLGAAYTFGQVVDKDEAKGFAWYKRAAESTAPEWRSSAIGAMFFVGYGLAAGRGTAANAAEAVEWYGRAAARGHIAAQNNLGVLYRDGTGVGRDPVEAYKWLALAANKNFALAKKNLDGLAPSLSAEQREEAQRRVAAWKPTN